MTRPTLRSAITHVNNAGILLLFPIKSNPKVPSLWNCFHPRSKMDWDWSDDGNDKVPQLWHLREELSRSRRVVYTKWFQGRATLISLKLFTAMLNPIAQQADPLFDLPESSHRLYRALLDDSPLATKALKLEANLAGRENEAEFQRGLKALWHRLLIVGYGEVDEGGFPSLAVGCVRYLFEEIWESALTMRRQERDQILAAKISKDSPFYSPLRKTLAASFRQASDAC